MNLNDKQITRLRMIGYPIVTEKNQRVSDALQWFRDEKEIVCAVRVDIDIKTKYASGRYVYDALLGNGNYKELKSSKEPKPFPEAESALLEALIKYEEEKK